MASHGNPYANLRGSYYTADREQSLVENNTLNAMVQTYTATNTNTWVGPTADNTWGTTADLNEQALEQAYMQIAAYRQQPQYLTQGLTGGAPDPRSRVHQRVAEIRGLALLIENLTPAQQKTYDEHGWFEVKGGTSGKTYRITYGHTYNVQEMEGDSKVASLCFGLRSAYGSNYVIGDHLLAQKICLEADEEATLLLANRHRYNRHRYNDGAVYVGVAPESFVTDPSEHTDGTIEVVCDGDALL